MAIHSSIIAWEIPWAEEPGGLQTMGFRVTESCPTLCDPMDCSPPGSYVHGILQAIILEWIAISYSRGSSRPRDQTCVSSHFLHWQQILYHCATWEDTLKAAGV